MHSEFFFYTFNFLHPEEQRDGVTGMFAYTNRHPQELTSTQVFMSKNIDNYSEIKMQIF